MALDSNGDLVPVNGPGAVDLSVELSGGSASVLSMMMIVLLPTAVIALV